MSHEQDLYRLQVRVERLEAAEKAPSFAETVARVIEKDPHQWSKRPCQTCSVVSSIVGRPFGCEALSESRPGLRGGAAR